MKSTIQTQNTVASDLIETAKSLRTLYFTRAAFSIVWVILVVAFAKTDAAIATVLFIIYPAWDAFATLLDIKVHASTGIKTLQYVNVGISIATTVAVLLARHKVIPEVVIVFGVWAILTGLIQLLQGLRRRKQLGGQWPMIISGGQPMLAGVSFIAMAQAPNSGIITLAGYAAFGAFYFLLGAFRLSKTL